MSGAGIALVVLAKSPRPGVVKTRLCPPFTPAQAALLAEAALRDTIAAVTTASAARRVISLAGEPGSWCPRGFEVIAQRGAGLGDRLASTFADVAQPAVVVGMDTPQLTPALLDTATAALADGNDAVLGHANDGGYWAIGLRRPDARVFRAIPMSTDHTGRAQLARLRDLYRRVSIVEPLRDVDDYADALAVATGFPDSRFARMFRAIASRSVAS